jgi:hypothetical protein
LRISRNADRQVASALDQHIENLALVIDGTPEIHPLAADAHHHLVQMPAIARPTATLAQPSRDRGTELEHPSPHRFVGDVEPSFGQQFLDIATAQGEAEIQPNRVLDDLGREAMAAVAERSHAVILSDTPLAPDPVSPLQRCGMLCAGAELAVAQFRHPPDPVGQFGERPLFGID